jgi:hypothetical protein
MSDDDIINWKLLGRRIADVQQSLRELRFLADIDRRNSRDLYDSLTFEVARQIGALDAKVEALAERIEERFDEIAQLIKGSK